MPEPGSGLSFLRLVYYLDLDFCLSLSLILPSASDLLQYQCWEWRFGSFCFVLFYF